MALPKRKLGRTGLEVTQLGYGSMGIRGPNTWGVRVVDEENAERILHEALDAGINFVDTSPDYGISEERIGRYLAGRRNEFYLATKCGCDYVQHDDHIEINHTWSKETIVRNLETSLQRLRTDHIDLLQFHGGDAKSLADAGLIDLLLDFRRQGTVGHIGMSNKLPHLPDLIELDVFDTFQIPYSCLAPEHDSMISAAANTGAGIIIRGGIAHGGPDAEIKRPALQDVWTKAGLDELTQDMSRSEFILRYTLSHTNCDTTIVGTCNSEHLEENVEACMAGPLDQATMKEVERRVTAIFDASS